MEAIIYNYYLSPVGELEMAQEGNELLWLKFFETQKEKRIKQEATGSNLFTKAKEQLDLYFKNELDVFDLPLSLRGTDFQKSLWQKLKEIPFGKTISYLTLSKQVGDVKAIRAVASTNGKNRFCIIIPCHRVIGTNGSLTGYAGDLWRKKWLLEHELKRSSVQTELF
ncbi:MAG: methylated-DNA--[protein]-cysteine S-methyltransferase [Bacteroidetes bacterium]|nr:methylated-DNA--[protein]-cysteine S-methyltransferase [Bacteroidota bacterium]